VRITIDARAADGPPTGIAWYVRTLLRALAESSAQHHYLLLRQRVDGAQPLVGDPRFEEVAAAPSGDLWLEFNLEPILQDFAADVYHSPLGAPAVVCPAATVMTVHDVIPRVMPEVVDDAFRQYFNDRLAPGLRWCDHLIAVSRHTAHDLTHLYGIGPDSISVVPEAAPAEHVRAVAEANTDSVLASLGVCRPYLLYVGAVEARKNVAGLLDAFGILAGKGNDLVHLVLVGAARDNSSELARRLRQFTANDHVLWLEEVSPPELCSIYSGATAFVFPSLYEGFGLPVLEAMSHGLPVIVSRVSSLPELVGEAGMLINPYDVGELASAMGAVASRPALRADLGTRSARRATHFTPAAMAGGTLGAYRNALEVRASR